MLVGAALVAFILNMLPAIQPATGCLHTAGAENADQRARKVAALGATRAINTAESMYSAKHNRAYATREELVESIDASRYNLAENAEIVPGFMLTLDTTPNGYWFEVKDVTDSCGFRFISNQKGLIFTAEPIQ